MKVLSINTTHTKSRTELFLNVDATPTDEAIKGLQYGSMYVHIEDGLLCIRTHGENATINATTIKDICEEINTLEKKVAEEKAIAANKRDNMLADISRITGFPLDK